MTKRPPSRPAMTPKQAAFVSEYMIDHNGTQAAIRAGYSKRTARQQAVELLDNADVQQAIQAAELSAQQRNALTLDDLLSELEDARQLAKMEGQASAMVSATMSKAKMLGFDKPQPAHGQQQGEITFNVIRATRPTRIELVAPDLDEHGRAIKDPKDMTDAEIDAELMKLESTTAMLI